MKLVIFLDSKQTSLNNKLLEFCKDKFEILNIFDSNNIYENYKFDKNMDFSISFLNPYIIRDTNIINKKCINFHPSTPKYRGVCGASMALYYNDNIFGATAHYINDKIDKGDIISTITFNIENNIDCYELSNISKLKCLELAKNILTNIYLTNNMPPINNNLKWGNIFMSKNKFKKMLYFNIDNEELEKIIKATKNNTLPGPFIVVNNKTYSLTEIT